MTSLVDIITSKDVKELLSDKYILILGDSVVRGIYKDLIKFSNSDDLLNEEELRIKGENRFYNDRLINGGVQKGLTNGTDYEEVREYNGGGRLRIRFYFITRCYSSYIKQTVFNDIKNQAIKPDIIIMNSCVWDISRYGIYAMKSYRRNLDRIMGSFRQLLPDALFLWLSALPVSNSSKGGVIVPTAEYVRPILPGLIRDGNYHCSEMCHIHDALYIDIHSVFSTMLHLRRPDGIHWCAIGHRLMNEIIFNHMKSYYHGVKAFKCRLLRKELGEKINTFKTKKTTKTCRIIKNYLDQDFTDDDNEIKDDENNIINLKRKRDNDDEKENNRKVVIKSKNLPNQQRTVIIKKSNENLPIDNNKFDHEYCDIMYDNEYEGLQMFHFSSYDLEVSEDLIQNECIIESSENLIESAVNHPVPEEEKIVEPSYIVLSSDDEDEAPPTSIIHTSCVLPIYLLNRLSE